MALVVDLGGEAAAQEIPALREVGVVNDVVAGVEIAAVIAPDDLSRWAVFSRRLDESVAELELTPEGLVDSVSGTVFDPFLGLGRSGPLADQSLDELAAFTSFPSGFVTFFPEGKDMAGLRGHRPHRVRCNSIEPCRASTRRQRRPGPADPGREYCVTSPREVETVGDPSPRFSFKV